MTTQTKTARRYTTMSVPMNDDQGAFWFVFDLKMGRSVEEADSYEAARNRARELNDSL